jgi:dTDP-glucose 4,6-dehydratase
VNVAAQSEEAASWTHSWRFFETNTLALAKLVEPLIGRQWLSKWIQVGTAGVYGHLPGSATEDQPLHPATPYAVSKAAADWYLLSVSRVRGFPVNILRPSNLYGPGQHTHKIIPKAILCALLGKTLALHGGGLANKSYVYVEDFARAISLAAEKGPPGKAYNCGSSDSVTVRDVVQLICDKVGASFKELVQLAPARMGPDSASSVDSALIAADLGWSPQIPLEKGLDETIAWAKQHLDILKTQPTEFIFQA